ncbi:MAG TPA: Gfo/Idh/MocA family oxidoreductase [Phycisphaeraceae bacterium]
MRTKPLGLGVIGCGVIGQRHMQAAAERPDLFRLAAVADLRAQAAAEAGRAFNVDAVYTDASSLLEDRRVEAVVLAMPTAGRAELAIEAFSRGKHVLLEKPAAMSAQEVQRLIDAQQGLVGACCSSRLRFLRCVGVVEDLLRKGELGEIRAIRSRGVFPIGPTPQHEPPAWRLSRSLNGGGLAMNWGCYDLDLILGLTGWRLKPQAVMARQWAISPGFESHVARGSDGETHFIALIGCQGGLTISLERIELAPAHGETVCEIIGTKGSLRFKAITDMPNEVTLYTADPVKGTIARACWSGVEDDQPHHRGPVQDFAAAVLEGKAPKTGLKQALAIHQIIDAMYESARACSSVVL